MSDLISRQEVIDLIMENDPWWCEGMTRTIFDGIDRLPSIDAEPQWIPVSEKLPKYSDTVLVSLFDGELDFGSYFCKRWHVGGLTLIEEDIVLAWMPLPEPYEGEC